MFMLGQLSACEFTCESTWHVKPSHAHRGSPNASLGRSSRTAGTNSTPSPVMEGRAGSSFSSSRYDIAGGASCSRGAVSLPLPEPPWELRSARASGQDGTAPRPFSTSGRTPPAEPPPTSRSGGGDLGIFLPGEESRPRKKRLHFIISSVSRWLCIFAGNSRSPDLMSISLDRNSLGQTKYLFGS